MDKQARGWTLAAFVTAGGLAASVQSHANGIYVDGHGARSSALGGAGVAATDDILAIMGDNPAGLGMIGRYDAAVSLSVFHARGDFTDSTGSRGKLDDGIGAAPEAAISIPLGETPLTLGVGLMTDAALQADWTYIDPAGGGTGITSYGRRKHFSEIILLRAAAGLAYQITDQLSIGAALGIVYNENRLEAPYIFQSQPALQGLKTLLDLETDGFGVNGTIGLIYRLDDETVFGLSYLSPTRVNSTGTASGNADAQLDDLGSGFDGVQRDFNYDAEVVNNFPQKISAGMAWAASEEVRFLFQVDWINWSDAFDRLEVKLKNGNNTDLNGLVGSSAMQDSIPLDWEDRFVYRAGMEYTPTDNWALRLGYSYGRSPVPDATLTPMTAAIIEHTIGAGVGYHTGGFSVDLGYQFGLPNSQTVETSDLFSGEYNNSEVEVELHILRLAASYAF